MTDTGLPLRAPVGASIVSRMFDVFGNTINRGAPLGQVQVMAVGERVRGASWTADPCWACSRCRAQCRRSQRWWVASWCRARRARPGGRTARPQGYLVTNRPASDAGYAPVGQRLLPLDDAWCLRRVAMPWPTGMLPETMGDARQTLRALIREYLFVSIFSASAEPLSSENASRLAAMDRADRNIEKMLVTLHDAFHRLRQSRIDEELPDVLAGWKALRPL